MCGLVGWVGRGKPPAADLFLQATEDLRHRGPDDQGIYSDNGVMLGHRRLAILDLRETGRQPMEDSDSGAQIVFNGEIYNYLELRQELLSLGYVFRTETDTEVLLQAYLRWGSDCLRRLNGMFAFAVWRPSTRELFFARDRFGVKPFYYAVDDGAIYFASEPKAILRLRPDWRTVNQSTLYEFLELGRLHVSESTFCGKIKILPAASCGSVVAGKWQVRIQRYWNYPSAKHSEVRHRTDEDEFSQLLRNAVALRLRSDVPVGVTLSGGLDSSAILAEAAGLASQSPQCFTSVFPEHDSDEGVWARRVASSIGLEPNEIDAHAGDWIETLEKIAWHMDCPGYSPAVYPLWKLMQRARETDVPVLLEGQGADEALGGYAHYGILQFRLRMKNLLAAPGIGKFGSIYREWTQLEKSFSRRSALLWLLRETFPGLINFNRKRVGAGATLRREVVSAALNAGAGPELQKNYDNYDPLTDRLWQDHCQAILPGLLQYGDAVSMAHSIESRQPFLDFRLVEWLFERPGSLKIRRGETKWILRQYLRRVGLQEVANRHRKIGYLTLEDRWMANENYEIPRRLLLEPDSKIADFCESKKIERLLSRHAGGAYGAGNHLYRLISTELWLRSCL